MPFFVKKKNPYPSSQVVASCIPNPKWLCPVYLVVVHSYPLSLVVVYYVPTPYPWWFTVALSTIPSKTMSLSIIPWGFVSHGRTASLSLIPSGSVFLSIIPEAIVALFPILGSTVFPSIMPSCSVSLSVSGAPALLPPPAAPRVAGRAVVSAVAAG